ncbi:host-nuclease inhibitor Gam family protein [Desulfoplanes formicivorans]|uniref:Host-nuclease inhibitor protein Gam n=1 Tax=Desulfoplanes formicivorans TaxID=1592317 RepID=A0A194AFK9_9BACT|nr:host-nuclease inhibitor Gam family protein [Desulfoplanes formicivorans]GAU08118.1 host-nuclease inhibitor protein Gam [Desulfoplanes formicivorans]
MARQKPKNLYPVKDLAAANKALAEIAELKRSIKARESAMNDEIDRLKAETEAAVAPLQAKMASLENGLLAFAEFNKDELFVDKRSKDLDFGCIGYRRSKEIKPMPKKTLAMVLGKLKELGFTEAIRVKESVNKDELSQWSDEKLALVHARRVEKDTFWYEIAEQEIKGRVA